REAGDTRGTGAPRRLARGWLLRVASHSARNRVTIGTYRFGGRSWAPFAGPREDSAGLAVEFRLFLSALAKQAGIKIDLLTLLVDPDERMTIIAHLKILEIPGVL